MTGKVYDGVMENRTLSLANRLAARGGKCRSFAQLSEIALAACKALASTSKPAPPVDIAPSFVSLWLN